MKKNILLTGKPGIGKTTLIKKVIEDFRGRKGGFYTEEIREKGERVGFRIKTFQGREGILAHINEETKFRVGKYGVNIEDLENIAAKSVEEAIIESDLIIMDELGRMELYSPKFQEVVIRALNSQRTLLGSIQERSNQFLDRIREREDVQIIRVSQENRESLIPEVKKLFFRNEK
jgi:nucleoside-triphosphatase